MCHDDLSGCFPIGKRRMPVSMPRLAVHMGPTIHSSRQISISPAYHSVPIMSSQQVTTPGPLALSSAELKVFGRHYIDSQGRIVHLRGANVSASAKVYVFILVLAGVAQRRESDGQTE
jgi:hypothetical protein